MHEGNGTIQAIIDERASEEQVNALAQALSGEHGDTLFEIVAFVCSNQLDPVFAPFEFEFDLENRTGRVRAGDHSAETAVSTRIRRSSGLDLDLTNSHASLAWVTRGAHVGTGAEPTVVA